MEALYEFKQAQEEMAILLDNAIFIRKAAPHLDAVYKRKITVEDFCLWIDAYAPEHMEHKEWMKNWLRQQSFDTKQGSNSVWENWFDAENIFIRFTGFRYMFHDEFMERVFRDIENQLLITKKLLQ